MFSRIGNSEFKLHWEMRNSPGFVHHTKDIKMTILEDVQWSFPTPSQGTSWSKSKVIKSSFFLLEMCYSYCFLLTQCVELLVFPELHQLWSSQGRLCWAQKEKASVCLVVISVYIYASTQRSVLNPKIISSWNCTRWIRAIPTKLIGFVSHIVKHEYLPRHRRPRTN